MAESRTIKGIHTMKNDTNYFEALKNLLATKQYFHKLLASDEFKWANFYDYQLTEVTLHNCPMFLEGDLRRIVVGNFNRVTMAVTIDNQNDGICHSTEVKVIVPDHLRDQVLNLKTDTGILLDVKYIKFDVAVHIFELVSIIKHNLPLKFAYCVCTGDNITDESAGLCKSILGYTKDSYSETCPLCGSTTKMVRNVYEDMG